VGLGGNRLSWAATPERVRRAIEQRLGSTGMTSVAYAEVCVRKQAPLRA
jgi:hypothetical protein